MAHNPTAVTKAVAEVNWNVSTPTGLTLLFEDDFESGDIATANFDWSGNRISTDRAFSGTSSQRYRFTGTVDPTGDASAEQRFALSQIYTELTIEYRLYIPANYFHRDSPSSDNNKFLRLWHTDYNDVEKIGFSLLPEANGDSYIGTDYTHPQNSSISTAIDTYRNFITDADRGQWLKIKIEVKAPTDVATGIMRLYKNDVLLIDAASPTRGAVQPGYRFGYFMGWANSGFAETTDLFIDDVKFYSGIGA